METEKKLKLLQLFYAGVLADSTSNYEKFGILDLVTEKKEAEQILTASGKLAQLGIDSPEKLFESFSEIFGCIQWKIEKQLGKLIASGNSCLLCAIAKKMNTAQPCHIYCTNPFKSFVSALGNDLELNVKETLWDGNKCEFEVFNKISDPKTASEKLAI